MKIKRRISLEKEVAKMFEDLHTFEYNSMVYNVEMSPNNVEINNLTGNYENILTIVSVIDFLELVINLNEDFYDVKLKLNNEDIDNETLITNAFVLFEEYYRLAKLASESYVDDKDNLLKSFLDGSAGEIGTIE